jgi:hypothetical protein
LGDMEDDVVELWMAAGADMMDRLAAVAMRELPPAPIEHPNFYPSPDRAHAERIARQYQLPLTGVGFVLRLQVRSEFTDMYDVHRARKNAPGEYWIPAGDLALFNRFLVAEIEIVAEHRRRPSVDNRRSMRDMVSLGRPRPRTGGPGAGPGSLVGSRP